jgi:hypothetical protein
MANSTTIAPHYDLNIHTHRCPDLTVECQTLVTGSGCPFDLLTIADVNFYPSKDQLLRIRDVIDAHLADQGADDRQAPPEQPAPLTQDEVDALPDASPDDSWAGRSDAVTLLVHPISGGCDGVPPPYEPTEADWSDYRRHMASVDALDVLNAARIDDYA